MSTGLEIVRPFERFPVVMCPGCAIAMTLRELHPVPPNDDLFLATYHCQECDTKTIRRFRRGHDHTEHH